METLVEWLVRKPATVVVCGKKNTGKSYSGRLLVNELLSKVAFLECDSGQPDFTMPGMLSLHLIEAPLSVAAPVLRAPVVQHYFGSSTVQSDPGYYLACIQSLYDSFKAYFGLAGSSREDSSSSLPPPLIVNTNGWMTGVGLDCLLEIVRYVEPAHIMHCRQPEGKELRDWVKSSLLGLTDPPPLFHYRQMDGLEAAPMRKKATGERERLLRAYFMITPSRPLMLQQSFAVPWNQLRVCVMHHSVHPSMVLDAINGLMGGLCIDRTAYSSSIVSAGNDDGSQGNWEEMPLVLQSTPIVECVGVGIIRDIDLERKEYLVITPVPLHMLQHANTFLRGDLEIPTSVLVEGSTTAVPYLCMDTLGSSDCAAAGAMKQARPTLVRQHQMNTQS